MSGDKLERLGAAIREAETVGVPWEVDETKPISKHVQKTGRVTVISPFAAGAIRLLLFTGCRLREILNLRWAEVDFGRGMLHLPHSKTGRLEPPALAVIAALPRAGDYVIHGDSPTQPRSDLKRPWTVVTRRAGIEGLRLHDLRHSFVKASRVPIGRDDRPLRTPRQRSGQESVERDRSDDRGGAGWNWRRSQRRPHQGARRWLTGPGWRASGVLSKRARVEVLASLEDLGRLGG